MRKRFANMCKYIIIGSFSLILIYLMLLACFSTTAITAEEHSFLIDDSAVHNGLGAGIFFLVLFLGRKAYEKIKQRTSWDLFLSKPYNYLYYLLAAIALIFVLCSHKAPQADQFAICNVAYEWSNGDYSSFIDGHYLNVYPNQAGIVVVLYLLGIVFGSRNYIVLQLINVAALLQLIRNTVYISGLKERSVFRDVVFTLFCLLFFPCVMYTTFVYGTLIGLSLAIASFRHLLCFEANRKRKHAVLSVIFIFLSIMVKQNFYIFGIAIIFYVIYKQIDRFDINLLVLTIIISVVVIFSSSIIGFFVYQITGQHPGRGMSSLSWISMGIKESDIKYDGWWDRNVSTIDTFKECNYDHDRHAEVCRDRIKERINEFKNDPLYTIRFFAGKNASQWNNPDFQGWWVNASMGQNGESVLPAWLGRLMTVWVYNHTVFIFLNYLQFVILFGVVMYLLFGRTNETYILLMIVFVGGFLFHTIWEAKGQYTFVYFFLLLPMSAEGYIRTLRTIDNIVFSDRRKLIQVSIKAAVLALLLLIVGVGSNPLLNSIFIRNEDTEAYHQYLSSNSLEVISNAE